MPLSETSSSQGKESKARRHSSRLGCSNSEKRPPPGLSAPGAALADHEIVEGIFGDLPPQILVGAERHVGIGDLLEFGIFGAELRIEIVGGLVAGLDHILRKQPQFGAADHEAF